MVSIVYRHPYERDERLARLGVTRDEWIEVVKACVAGRSNATDNDPKSAGGLLAWIYGTRQMRRLLRPKGLEKDDVDGIETVVDRTRKVRFAIVSTDENTCNADASPRNRTEKGAATEKVTDLNNQHEMDYEPPSGRLFDLPAEGDGYIVWYLCVFDDGNEVRAELSSPVKFKSGHFIKFSERIFILGPGEWDQVSIDASGDDDTPLPDIDVRRK